jgi:hypothetical protein
MPLNNNCKSLTLFLLFCHFADTFVNITYNFFLWVLEIVSLVYTFVLKLSIILNMQSIYEQISAYGLIGELYCRVVLRRPSVSRNTIHLAFRSPTTPLRKMIVRLAEELVSEHEASVAMYQGTE